MASASPAGSSVVVVGTLCHGHLEGVAWEGCSSQAAVISASAFEMSSRNVSFNLQM